MGVLGCAVAAALAPFVVVGGVAYQWQRDHNAPRQMAFVKPKAETAPAVAPPKPAPPTVQAAVTPAPVVETPAPLVVEKKQEEKKPVTEKKLAAVVQVAAAPPSSGSHRIVMRVETDEAWLEVTDATGRQLVSSLNRAGSERVVQGRGPFTFVIGNASHVRVEHNGREFDLKPHTRVEVARFTLP